MSKIHAGSEQLRGPIRLEGRPRSLAAGVEIIFVRVEDIDGIFLACFNHVMQRERMEHVIMIEEGNELPRSKFARAVQGR